MSITFVFKLATFLLFASTNAATPSYEDLISMKPPISRFTHRLPNTTVPGDYQIHLRIDPDNSESFSGNVEIDIIAKNNTREITLHAHNGMEIENITVTNTIKCEDIFSNYEHSETDDNFLKIKLKSDIKVGDRIKLRIEYIGMYNAEEGIYIDSYLDETNEMRNVAITQFQPVSAREAFPCYDEPHLKARFTLVIYHPKKFDAISNMEVDISSNLPDIDNFKGTEFRRSPLMSTYLIAFVVSNYASKSNYLNQIFPGKTFRMFARATVADSLDYPLNFAQRSLMDLEKYTNLSYLMPKMDNVALPVIQKGAMENWGLVIYNEELIVFNNNTSSTADEQTMAALISHENAHMWFGNVVTLSWWSYLWLNEGFATYFEYYTTDSVLKGKFRMMEQFVVTNMQTVMKEDATNTTNAMTNNVESPSEIDNNFNVIAYKKSGSVIRMIQHVLGKNAFHFGLENYIKKQSTQVTEPKHLYSILEDVANLMPDNIRITNVFESWANQKGFPLVSVIHKNDRKIVTFNQRRYYRQNDIESEEQWYIPLTWAYKEDADFENTTVQHWLKPGDVWEMNLKNTQPWLIVNKQQMGYYRVMYDKRNWIGLSNALQNKDFDGIHHLNRAQLIDDGYEFATSLRLSFNITMKLLSYLKNEDNFIPWITAKRILNDMDIIMEASENNQRYRRFASSLSKNIYDKFGIDAKAEESSIDKLHRDIALSLQCNAGISSVRSLANDKIKQIVTDPGFKIDPDLKCTIYCCGLRSSSEEEWDAIFEKYLEATRLTEKYMVLNALGCTEDKKIAYKYLNMSISDDSRVDDDHRPLVVIAMINGGATGLTYALYFLFDNFEKFQNMTAEVNGGVSVISALQNRVVAKKHAKQYLAFRSKYYLTFKNDDKLAIDSAIKVLTKTYLWLYTALREIDPWLIDNVSNSSRNITTILIMLITMCIMLLIIIIIYIIIKYIKAVFRVRMCVSVVTLLYI